jgi:hypothetical protein
MCNPATWPQTTHMILAAYLVTGFGVASVYAVALLRARRDRYHRLGFLVPFVFAAALTPVQIGVGDWAAHFVADNQPVKLAAMERVFETERGAPLHLGGIEVDGQMRYAIEIPFGLSLLAYWTRTPRLWAERGPARPAPTRQRRASVVPDHGGDGDRPARARRLVRARLAASPRPAPLAMVSGLLGAVGGGRRGGPGGRVDHDRGRPATMDRVRLPAYRRRGERRAGAATGAVCPDRRLHGPDRGHRLRAAAAGQGAAAGRAAGDRAGGAGRPPSTRTCWSRTSPSSRPPPGGPP